MTRGPQFAGHCVESLGQGLYLRWSFDGQRLGLAGSGRQVAGRLGQASHRRGDRAREKPGDRHADKQAHDHDDQQGLKEVGSMYTYCLPSVVLNVSILVGADPVGAAGISVEDGLPTTNLVAPFGPCTMM